MKDLFIQWLEELTEEEYNNSHCMDMERIMTGNQKIQEFCENRLKELDEIKEKDRMLWKRMRYC